MPTSSCISTAEEGNEIKKTNIRTSVIAFVLASLLNVSYVSPAIAADGALDSTFGTGGKVTTTFGGNNDIAYRVAVQSDGKIVVTGMSNTSGTNDFAIARYNANGSLDTTFGKDDDHRDGKVLTDLGGSDDEGFSVALQSDGKIVVAGWTDAVLDNDFALARYNANGSLDTTFGKDDDHRDGKVITDLGGSNDYVTQVALQSDGKIVVAGWTLKSGAADFALARYNADGTLDTTFGKDDDHRDGKVLTDLGGSDDQLRSVVLQSDGKIVVAGYTNKSGTYDFAIARYNADGTLDTTFGKDDDHRDGTVITDFGGRFDLGFSVALQSDGKIVAAGFAANFPNTDFALVRYNANGSLDESFGTDKNGKVITDLGGSDDGGYSVALQSDGKIVVAGWTNPRMKTEDGFLYDFGLARYNTHGTLDTTFGTGGQLNFNFGGNDDEPYSITVQSDGKIVVAGYTTVGPLRSFAIARISSSDAAAEAARVAAAAEAARVAAAAEAARVAAAAEAAKKVKEQKELTELLSVIPSIAGLALNLGDLTNSLLTTKCVKGKTVKYVKKGSKCPKRYVKK